MMDKKTHFGRAGEYFAMSELLLRGWNVAVPVVDVGDDAFIIDDTDKKTRRVQVKTSTTENDAGTQRATFLLSRRQLRSVQAIELFFVLLMRAQDRWRMLVVPREALLKIKNSPPQKPRRGAPRKSDDDARSDSLTLVVEISEGDVTGWGVSLAAYLDCWPSEIPCVAGGPGSDGRGETIGAGATSSKARDP